MLKKNIGECPGKRSGEWSISRITTRLKEQQDWVGKKCEYVQNDDKTGKATGLGGEEMRGHRKRESNDSPEISDKRWTLDIPGLPSGVQKSSTIR